MDTPQQPPKPILDSKEQFELQVRAAERAHDVETEFGKNANEAALESGREALKAMILVNGGSSVAMLAFIGTLASKDVLPPNKLAEISSPLIWFATGLILAMIASAGAYFTNLMIAGSSSRQTREYEFPFLRDTKSSKRHRFAGEIFRHLTVAAAAASIGCFGWGVWKAKTAFDIIAVAKQSPK